MNNITSSRVRLEAYLNHRLINAGSSLANDTAGSAILREICCSVFPPVINTQWNRRPSISDNGDPVVLSWKAGKKNDDFIRVLVEPGSLKMTVAQQISYSLTRLDNLLRLLQWSAAASQINSIISKVFPAEPNETLGWRGGIWLGAEISNDTGEAELRMYLNLRHGNHKERWLRLLDIISAYSSETIIPFLNNWSPKASLFSVPVGLGIVIAGGKIKAIRAYLSVKHPSVETIEGIISYDNGVNDGIKVVYNGFVSNFGKMSDNSVTIGCDFVQGAKKPPRMKADICCHIIAPEYRVQLVPWINKLLKEFSFEAKFFGSFIQNVHLFWNEIEIQFLSLGFTPELKHATVYVKPSY